MCASCEWVWDGLQKTLVKDKESTWRFSGAPPVVCSRVNFRYAQSPGRVRRSKRLARPMFPTFFLTFFSISKERVCAASFSFSARVLTQNSCRLFVWFSFTPPFCRVVSNNVYIEVPREFGLDQWTVLAVQEQMGATILEFVRLQRCWYGSRDAGQASESAVRGDFEVNHFSQGASSPFVQGHKTRWVWYFVHKDDNVGLGAGVYLEWYRRQISKSFIMKFRGHLGLAAQKKA